MELPVIFASVTKTMLVGSEKKIRNLSFLICSFPYGTDMFLFCFFLNNKNSCAKYMHGNSMIARLIFTLAKFMTRLVHGAE